MHMYVGNRSRKVIGKYIAQNWFFTGQSWSYSISWALENFQMCSSNGERGRGVVELLPEQPTLLASILITILGSNSAWLGWKKHFIFCSNLPAKRDEIERTKPKHTHSRIYGINCGWGRSSFVIIVTQYLFGLRRISCLSVAHIIFQTNLCFAAE